MFRFWKIPAFCLLLLASVALYAQQVKVDSLRYWTAPDHTRMVFDVSNTLSHQVFLLHNPDRLVIDLNNTKLNLPLKQPPASHPLFSRVRSALRNKTDLRVVVDLKTAVTPKSFT
jgi:N-acetylmuramoyl-L-alanine amidase